MESIEIATKILLVYGCPLVDICTSRSISIIPRKEKHPYQTGMACVEAHRVLYLPSIKTLINIKTDLRWVIFKYWATSKNLKNTICRADSTATLGSFTQS